MAKDHWSLAQAFLASGRRRGWGTAAAYLRESLPYHAAEGDVLDELLSDPEYLAHADLDQLLAVAHRVRSHEGRDQVLVLRRTRGAYGDARAAACSVQRHRSPRRRRPPAWG
jgi:hypothetical protein